MFNLSKRSIRELEGVHPDLVKVVFRAIQLTEVDFLVFDGVRTLAEQKKHLAAGSSWTLNSRHLTGHAVDLYALVAGKARFEEALYPPIAKAMKAAAKELGVPIQWGYDLWKKDSVHFQLPRKVYPA
jgi:peptidoglycan LD-endopeptidase CwlK